MVKLSIYADQIYSKTISFHKYMGNDRYDRKSDHEIEIAVTFNKTSSFKEVYTTHHQLPETSSWWPATIYDDLKKMEIYRNGKMVFSVDAISENDIFIPSNNDETRFLNWTILLKKDDIIDLQPSKITNGVEAGWGNDVIYGSNQSDGVWGDNNSRDRYSYTIDDSSPKDTVKNTNDKMFGRDGNDYLRGEHGNDILYGENGLDVLDGGNDSDTLFGGDGNDSLYAGIGDKYEYYLTLKILNIDDGNDKLYGEDGNDVLRSGRKTDTLDGGSGNDKLYAWDYGNTLMYGGTGEDKFIFMPQGSSSYIGDQDMIFDFHVGDKIDLSHLSGIANRSNISIAWNDDLNAYLVQDVPSSQRDDIYIKVRSDHTLTANDFIF